MTWAGTLGELETRADLVKQALRSSGFTAYPETANTRDAFFSAVPGELYSNARAIPLPTKSLADLSPTTAIWTGPMTSSHQTRCARRPQPPLITTITDTNSPFRLDTYLGDVGGTKIIGPAGSGKSVKLNAIASQFTRYYGRYIADDDLEATLNTNYDPKEFPARVIIIDKDRSCRANTLAHGGRFIDLDTTASFQPLASIDLMKDRAWAHEWLIATLAGKGVAPSDGMKQEIWTALDQIASQPRHMRTLTNFAMTVQDQTARAAIREFTLEGAHGRLLDSADAPSPTDHWISYELGDLMSKPSAITPVLGVLFRQIESLLDGRPTLISIDEMWKVLDHPYFAAGLKEMLKRYRKRNALVIGATQSVSDIASSSISATLMEEMRTTIYLANPEVKNHSIRPIYQSQGLNEAEIDTIARAIPKRQYFVKSTAGARLYELALSPLELAFYGSSSDTDQDLMDTLIKTHPPGPEFARAFLLAKNKPDLARAFDHTIAQAA